MVTSLVRYVLGKTGPGAISEFNPSALSTLRGRLEFVRDTNGVAHLYAEREPDLYHGVGYLQGRERFVLLDLLRHLGQGRLSELLFDIRAPQDADWFAGVQLSEVDAFVLPLGFAADAKRDFARLPQALQHNVRAFSAGINAALVETRGLYPPEFLLLGEVRPWTPEDCLLLARTCGFVIGLLPLENELTFANVRAQEGDEIARLLYPEAPWDKAPEFSVGGGAPIPDGPVDPPNIGSNNWAISSVRSASGAPIVCNDPHVPFVPGPTYWHHVHLQCADMNVQGGMFPGFPAFGFGHNLHTAWGVTSAFRDSWDLFRIHRVRAAQPSYRTEHGEGRIQRHQAQIKPRLRAARTIRWESCEHGIIYPDWQFEDGSALALKYVSCDLAACLTGHRELMRADTVERIQSALEKINDGPFDFNMVYGHRGGHIAWEQIGRLPKRRQDGLFLRDAHAPGASWRGYLPFSNNPKIINPNEGLVVSANSITCAEQFHKLATPVHCEVPYRQDRIKHLITARSRHTWESLAAIQADVQADFAMPLRDALLNYLHQEQSADAQFTAACEAMAGWGGSFAIDQIGATVFYFTRMQLAKEVFGAVLGSGSVQRFIHGQRAWSRVDRLLRDPEDPMLAWLVNNRNQSLADFVRTAFEKARQFITQSLGPEVSQWQWGKIHYVKIGALMSEVPGIGKPWVALETAWPGETNTVSPTVAVVVGKKLRSVVGASSRFVCDLGNPKEAWFAHSSGPSCHPDSPFLKTVAAQWAEYRYFKSGLWQPHEVPNPVEHVIVEPNN